MSRRGAIVTGLRVGISVDLRESGTSGATLAVLRSVFLEDAVWLVCDVGDAVETGTVPTAAAATVDELTLTAMMLLLLLLVLVLCIRAALEIAVDVATCAVRTSRSQLTF